MSNTFNPILLNFDGNPAPKIRRYNTWETNFTWVDSDNISIDLSYYSAHMHLRKNTQADITIALSTSNGRIFLDSEGQIKLKILSSDTATIPAGKYQYDLILSDNTPLDSNGEGMSSFTLFCGEIIVEDSITRESV